ncbi:putative quinol monooxygenase [Streptomyces sp. NPDC002144]
MAIAISATWTARSGKEDVVRDALAKLVPVTRAEPGCQAVGQAAPALADRSHAFTAVLNFRRMAPRSRRHPRCGPSSGRFVPRRSRELSLDASGMPGLSC